MPLDPLSDFDQEILRFLHDQGVEPDAVQLQVPKQREFGERAVAVFTLAKERRQNPDQIAELLANAFNADRYRFIARIQPVGGYVNFHLNYQAFIGHVIEAVRAAGQEFGRRDGIPRETIVVEHTSVNPNKEWHIGHVRNAVIGDVVTRLLRLVGHDVQVQNYIDDTGLQAAQAIFGLETFPERPQPGEKFDHYAGRLYVKIAAELGAEKELEERLRQPQERDPVEGTEREPVIDERMSIQVRLDNVAKLKQGVVHTMHRLEAGEDHDLVGRILNGQLETAYRLGIFYNLLTWESHLVRSHVLEEALKRLSQSPSVYRSTEGRYKGALIIQTEPTTSETEEPKADVLIRSNGIPTYVGKDIAYHMWKFGLVPDPLFYVEYAHQPNQQPLCSTAMQGERWSQHNPERIVNVIGVHQSQAQETVKEALRAAGFPEAGDELFHLAHGMVSTASGKISGRKGTTVAGDTVIEQAVGVALERVKEKRSADLGDDDMRSIAEAVGIGALRYFMVQYNPLREIVFDVADVVSYDGNTGLYVQYALVRMFAILRRAQDEHGIDLDTVLEADVSLLQHEQEKRLAVQLAQYPETVATASRTLAINLVAEYAYTLATIFSQFYRDCSVLNAEPSLRAARLLLVQTVRDVLANACAVLGIPVIERL